MARENQGLQVALIIFFMLTIILGVTTFIFFRQYEEADKKAGSPDKAVEAKSGDKSPEPGIPDTVYALANPTDEQGAIFVLDSTMVKRLVSDLKRMGGAQ